MAFVIHSAGNLAASRVRTLRARHLAFAVAALLVVAAAGGLAGGLAIGQYLEADGPTPAASPDAPFDPARAGNQALIDRVGTLSARLLRLESEALQLARQVGVEAPAPEPSPVDPPAEPSGGPLLPPEAALGAALTRLESQLTVVGATMDLVARHSSASALADMAFPSRLPIAGGRISSGFGNRRDPFTRRLARHTGVDLPAPRGTPILASAGGTVRFAGYRRAYGNSVEIDHGGGLVTRYAHASRLLVRRGQVVLPEQPIATVGSTGRSTGPHLHFEVLERGRPVPPLGFLERPAR